MESLRHGGRTIKAALVLAVLILAGVMLGGSGTYETAWDNSRGTFRGGSASQWTGDTLTYVFLAPGVVEADTATHNDPLFSGIVQNADSVFSLEDARAEFVWAQLDRFETDDFYAQLQNGNGFRWIYNTDMGDATDYYDITSGTNIDQSARRISLFRLNWASYITANAQIVDAYKRVTWFSTQSGSIGATDSLYTVLMTNESDSVWYQHVGTTGSPSADYVSHACWNRQQSTHPSGTYGYATTADATPDTIWTPALEDRNRFWDWGKVADARGFVSGPTDLEAFNLPLTNNVQAVVNGETNNGHADIYIDSQTGDTYVRFIGWEAQNEPTYGDNSPYIVVKWIHRKYAAPWPGGGEVAFAFVADGARDSLCSAAAAEYAVHGGKFTINARSHNIAATAPYAPISDLAAYYEAGVAEIACQSYFGASLAGYAVTWPANDDPFSEATNYTQGMYPETINQTTDTAWDQLLFTTDPEWMFHEFEQATGYSWRGRPLFATTFGHPGSLPHAEGLRVVVKQGFLGARMPQVSWAQYDGDGHQDPWAVTGHDAEGDSVRAGLRPQYVRGPQNWFNLGMSHGIESFVGVKAADPDLDQVTYYTRMELEKARASGRLVVGVFGHAVKSEATVASGNIDRDELDAMLDASDATFGCVNLSIGEINAQIKAYSTAVATPAGFGQAAAFRYTADDGVWRQLDGIDNRWIRGVR